VSIYTASRHKWSSLECTSFTKLDFCFVLLLENISAVGVKLLLSEMVLCTASLLVVIMCTASATRAEAPMAQCQQGSCTADRGSESTVYNGTPPFRGQRSLKTVSKIVMHLSASFSSCAAY
jgi:type III secretory pathway component EscR